VALIDAGWLSQSPAVLSAYSPWTLTSGFTDTAAVRLSRSFQVEIPLGRTKASFRKILVAEQNRSG
jgi:hypothetical protein